MEPVEINAGGYYLRQFRADRLMDDRPALVAAFADPLMRRFVPDYTIDTLDAAGDYVRRRAEEWHCDRRYSWAIAEPTTGDLLGEVGLKNLDHGGGNAEIAVWIAPSARGRGIATTAVDTVVRFGFGALGLREIGYNHDPDNDASRAVAQRCGFTRAGKQGRDLRWHRRAGTP
ncbi:GNAT family N-acetyltransferase [Saccharomonospora xinjiangensis]|uniref:Acetyltransferase, ribosomal protein N-acetylase n=1 Tax=Saccharomonospora xinjiangensis XJ-54 TaxID=882086 RepID=I0V0L8_9PSEU|nr:GNAT family N-acetyltransferase [Saccharomonospora xinjiangensis]EID53671.1 acetyltransferase, ribosomal protein N-acetylase [Saccharomonospora xinjiangensis XJ-54]